MHLGQAFLARHRLVDVLRLRECVVRLWQLLATAIENARTQECGGGLRIQLRRLHVRFNGSIEILVFLIGAAEIDIGRRLFPVSNRIHDERVLFNRRLEVAAESRRDRVQIVRLGGR